MHSIRSSTKSIRRSSGLGALLIFCSLYGCSSGSDGGSGGGPVARVDNGRSYSTIQAAIDAADEGSVIEIAAGTFAEELWVDKRLTLRGHGAGTEIRTHGNRSSSDDSSSNTRAGLTIINVQGLVLEDIEFSGNPEDGIVVRQSSNIRLLGIIANGNGDDGIDIRESTDIVIAASNTRLSEFDSNADRGIQIRDSLRVTIEGVQSTGNQGDGIRIRDSLDSSILSSVVAGNFESGVRVRTSEVQIRGDSIFDNLEYGVRLRESPEAVLSNTDFRNGNGRGNVRRD